MSREPKQKQAKESLRKVPGPGNSVRHEGSVICFPKSPSGSPGGYRSGGEPTGNALTAYDVFRTTVDAIAASMGMTASYLVPNEGQQRWNSAFVARRCADLGEETSFDQAYLAAEEYDILIVNCVSWPLAVEGRLTWGGIYPKGYRTPYGEPNPTITQNPFRPARDLADDVVARLLRRVQIRGEEGREWAKTIHTTHDDAVAVGERLQTALPGLKLEKRQVDDPQATFVEATWSNPKGGYADLNISGDRVSIAIRALSPDQAERISQALADEASSAAEEKDNPKEGQE